MKKTLFTVIVVFLLLSCTLSVVQAGSMGSGVAVLTDEVSLIKTGLLGKKLTFSDADFKCALGIESFDKVTITKLPPEEDGTLMLGGRKLGEGQSIRRRSVASLVFIPKDSTVTSTEFEFSVDNFAGGEAILCTLKFIDKINYAPTISEADEEAFSFTTQREISVWGKLNAEDSEGDELEYIIVSYPENGTVTITDKANGNFCYTPAEGFSGKDEFTFVVRDEYGNFSRTADVALKITERMSEVVYVDMLNSPSYNASVAMTGMGIMSGKRIGDDMYFMPEETVTRAEFVAMAMKALGISANKNLDKTFFDDNDLIPKSLISYVATAQKAGIIHGAFDGEGLNFRPTDAITKYEAGIIMANLIELGDVSVSVNAVGIGEVPVWARDRYEALCQVGIFDADEGGARDAVTREAASEYLYKLSLYGGK